MIGIFDHKPSLTEKTKMLSFTPLKTFLSLRQKQAGDSTGGDQEAIRREYG
jgi:hypothetical protein